MVAADLLVYEWRKVEQSLLLCVQLVSRINVRGVMGLQTEMLRRKATSATNNAIVQRSFRGGLKVMDAETVMYLPAGIIYIYIYIPAGFCGCLGMGSATTNGAALNLF